MALDPKTTITLSVSPAYVIDFKKYAKKTTREQVQLEERIRQVVYFPIRITTIFFQALIEANWSSLTHMRISFFQNVLGYYGPLEKFKPPEDLHLVVFKIAFWVLGTAWYTTTRACDLFAQRMWGDQQFQKERHDLTRFNWEIDMSHICTKQKALNASHVPVELQVGTLLTIFDAINFTDPTAPGYMAPTSRQEGKTTYTVQELRTSLEKFIHDVNNRIAFLGTPPAYDTPKLMRFYQHIENAVRLSLFKVSEDLRKFQETNGTDVSNYGEEELRAYKNLLENQARVVLDLSIAGQHCGARYMGDATTLYNDLHANEALQTDTLQDTLIELLARRRGEIARSEIQERLGTDTHSFSNYMSTLGPVLAIPGTENVVEHVSSPLDKEEYLRNFFKKYTLDDIIETVQSHIKTAAPFLDKIQTWIRDAEVGNWKPEGFAQSSAEILAKVGEIIQKPSEGEGDAFAHFNHLCGMLNELKKGYVGLKVDEQYLNTTSGPDLLVRTFCYLNEALHPESKQKKIDQPKVREAMRLYLNENRTQLQNLPQADFFENVFCHMETQLIFLDEAAESETFDLPNLAPLLGYMKYEDEKGGAEEFPWKAFWEEVFSLEASKGYLKGLVSSPLERSSKINQMKTICSRENLGDDLFKEFNSALLEEREWDSTHFKPRLERLEKVKQIRSCVSELVLEQEVLLRALDQENGVQDVIKARLELNARQAFIDAIDLLDMGKNGLSAEIMEWLLVSHRIFLPQNVEEVHE